MRNYECLFIANPNIEGDGMSSVVEKVTAYVKEAGAESRIFNIGENVVWPTRLKNSSTVIMY